MKINWWFQWNDIHFICVLGGNFSVRVKYTHRKKNWATNRFLDVTILRTFIAFQIDDPIICIFLKMCCRMTLIHHSALCIIMYARITPNNKNRPATILPAIHILWQFQIAHFGSHTRPEAHSNRRITKTTQQQRTKKTITTKKKYIHFEQTIH